MRCVESRWASGDVMHAQNIQMLISKTCAHTRTEYWLMNDFTDSDTSAIAAVKTTKGKSRNRKQNEHDKIVAK